MKRLVVGLAGGVGSGKSTVAALFRKWGARVVDADAVGHRVLDRPGIRARLRRAWGTAIFRNGRVDRRALAREAFRSRRSIERLNRIVHPAILREIRRRLRRARGCVVLDAALLFETGADVLCDRIVFVRAPRDLRVRRAASRGWSPGELTRRERFQWPVAYKSRKADYVIDNAGSRSRTERQARRIYEELRRLCR
ncbi:MAG TPA: dephospho-CoA kinase [Planctomycetota bacterium]|nr:dephospho-CoA kinase [Planctomycetota bacterium]